MSFIQSKDEKSGSQYKKSGPSVNSSNNAKGGGGNAPPPQPSLATNRSFKKPGTGGGQSRVGVSNSNSQFNTPTQNGGRFQSPASGFSEAPAPVGDVKPTNPPAPRSTRRVPKAPSSQTVPGGFDSVAPSTPSKADAPKSFQLQFGSISPVVVNGMQIPARTSSAPPNLDEQKREQAQHDSFRAPPTISPPSASKQQLPLKDSGTNKPLATEELHAASSHAKRDVHPQVPSAAGTTVTQKPSVHPIPGISMPMPFQLQVPIPFGGPNSQIQSQGVPTTSLQMPMPLSVGSGAHVQQQVFVQGLQSHPIQPQGMMPQGQNLSFTTQIGHQLPPQMANMGIGISPQYSQQPGKFVSRRKAVKITHPDTHEELRLDRRTDSYKDSGSSGVRSHPNVPPQTQPMPPITPHQNSYYPPMQPGSYNHSMYFLTTQIAVPLTSTQMSAYNHSSTASATVSTQRLSTSTSSSTASPSEESASVTGNTKGKQKETVRRTESFKDRQKKTGRKDAKNTRLLNQEDVSNHAGSVKLSSPRMSRDVTRGFDYASGPNVSVSSVTPHQDLHPDSNAVSDVILKHEKSAEITGCSLVSVPGSKDRPTSETNRAKSMTAKGKKKRKDILKAANAASSTSNLYMAYKGPEEKQENVILGESIESSCSILFREAQAQAPTVKAEKDIITAKEDGQIKGVPDDWEDAAELSTPKLKTFIGKQGRAGSAGNNEDGNISKKYSRDFLLTLSEQCIDVPTRFKIEPGIAEFLMSVQVRISHLVEREMYLNTGRNTDRTSGGPRPDRRKGRKVSSSK